MTHNESGAWLPEPQVPTSLTWVGHTCYRLTLEVVTEEGAEPWGTITTKPLTEKEADAVLAFLRLCLDHA